VGIVSTAGLVACLTHLTDLPAAAAKDTEKADKMTAFSGADDPKLFEQISDIAEWVEPEPVESFFTTSDWARTDAFIGIVSMISVVITFVLWVMSCSQWSKDRIALRNVANDVSEIKELSTIRSNTIPRDLLELGNKLSVGALPALLNNNSHATETSVAVTGPSDTNQGIMINGVSIDRFYDKK